MPETKTAVIHLSGDGVVIVTIRDGAYQSLEDAKVNLATALSETGGRRRPLLVDIRTARPLDADARHHYSGQVLIESFSAMALLVDGSVLEVRGRVHLGENRRRGASGLFRAHLDGSPLRKVDVLPEHDGALANDALVHPVGTR